ncbi:alpha/beta fold hydrolase [Micromonospora sp. NPDC049359]|uniref:alpha/beta fold hydrolase n=1 Tax=Micromonospora sp. NPDC049359 TaxID=3364270 RepID=UPI0037A283E9
MDAGLTRIWSQRRPEGRKSFKDDGADLLAVVETIGRPVHLVGGSYGATLALHMAAAEQSRLQSLAVFGPPLFAAGQSIAPLLDRYAALEREDAGEMSTVLKDVTRGPPAIVAAFAAAPGDKRPDPAEARRSAIGWLHDLEALTDDSTGTARWSSITVPTLLMQGADTWGPTPTTMNELAAAIPTARRVIWSRQSHFATMTAPDLVADALRDFFAGPDSR